MPGIVAIEWDNQVLRGVAARIAQKQLHLTGSLVLQVPASMHLENEPEQAGRLLREQLQQAGIDADKAIVSLPHDAVIVRHLELPMTPVGQVADLVRLQIATQSPETAENEIVDFLPLPTTRTERMGQDLMAVSVPKQRIAWFRQVMSAAKLELVSLGYAPLGLADFVANAVNTHPGELEAGLVLALRGSRLDILILHQSQLLFCHTARFTELPATSIRSPSILAEITRALIAADRLLANLQISVVRTIGHTHDQLRLETDLAERFHCSIQSMTAPEIGGSQDGPVSAADAGELAAPLGMLASYAAGKNAQINLLAPRQPLVARDGRKLRSALIAGLLLVVAAAGYLGFRSYLRQLENEKQQRQAELQGLEALLERGRPLLDSTALIGEWESRSVNWLNEMNRVGKAFPGTQLIYLQSWRFETVGGSTLGRIEADGYAAKRDDVERLSQYLAEQSALRVLPREIGQPASFSPEYPFRFDLDVDLELRSSGPKPDSGREANP